MVNGFYLIFIPLTLIADDNSIDLDAPPQPKYQVSQHVAIGVRLEVELTQENNYDLLVKRNDTLKVLEPKVSLATSIKPSSSITLFSNINLIPRFVDDQRRKKDDEFRLEINQLNLTIKELLPQVSLQLGRIRFHDKREWLFDEEVDGIRLLISENTSGIELSIFKRHHKDLLEASDKEYHQNYMTYLYLTPSIESQLGIYFLKQHHAKLKLENRHYLGMQAFGKFAKRSRYWLNTAILSGEDDETRFTGYGFDLAVYQRFKNPIRYSLFWGLAYGSGGKNNNGFRQTGLQDNAGKYEGLVRVKYYGEVTDPELNNVMVTTLGIGKKIRKNLSIELIHHYYQQASLSNEIRDWELEEETNGESPYLGQEIDLIIGYRKKPKFKSNFILGYFVPGTAFSTKFSSASYVELNLKYDF